MTAKKENNFIRLVKNPWKFRLFLLSKLPAGFFSGLRITEMDDEKCVVSVPFKWFNKNPFRSTYFASLAMAGELSTGALAMANVYGKAPAVSMLVTRMEADYFKKATGPTFFTCLDGEKFKKAVEAALATGEGQVVEAFSTGMNGNGELVARFMIRWSFKSKSVS